MAIGEPARFVEGAWPLLVVHLPALMNTAIAIESIIGGFERVLERDERFASIVECSAVAKFPGAVERKALVDWLGQDWRIEKERRLTIATAVVMPSGPMRAFLSAINWVRRPTAPQEWPATHGEAVEWCCERLVGAGVAITPALAALRSEHQRLERQSRRTK